MNEQARQDATARLLAAEAEFLRAHGWNPYVVPGITGVWWVQGDDKTTMRPQYAALVMAKWENDVP